MSKKEGLGGIAATIIKDSISEVGNRITTFELEYHRFIHGELMTHRMFSRNAMSSRAVPIQKMIEQVKDKPATPTHWGANQSGMQANDELDYDGQVEAKDCWSDCSKMSSAMAMELQALGLHKQIVNRVLEPFQMMKTIVTATEYDNFFSLRCHADAQPEIRVLAETMRDCMDESQPELLQEGQWHIPYVEHSINGYHITDDLGKTLELDVETALKISASCCAQVSYRLLDNSLDKALMIYDKLIESKPIHASPFEHQAKVMQSVIDDCESMVEYWEEGVTHMDRNSNLWSGNFKGWIQYRQLM